MLLSPLRHPRPSSTSTRAPHPSEGPRGPRRGSRGAPGRVGLEHFREARAGSHMRPYDWLKRGKLGYIFS
eukprot:scaffold7382_cov406-Prasinococcus_capsulatus_cf.AAC.9